VNRINAYLARLEIAHKLVLGSVAFALPIAVLLYYTVSGFNRGIRTAEREIAGARSLEHFPSLLANLRRLQSWSYLRNSGSKIADTGIADTRRRVSDALDGLGTSHSAAAGELVERLSGLWSQFQDRKRAMTAREQAMTYRLMTDAANQLVRLTLDDSSLVLDSELDTYYLIEFAGQLLLQSQTGVAQARLVLLRGTVDGSVEQRDMAVLQTLNENLNETLIPRLRQSLDTSIREDANFHGKSPTLERNLRPLAEGYLKKLTQLSSQLGRFAEMTDVNLRPEQIVESADAAERSGAILWQSAVRELRLLLERRVTDDHRNRAGALFLSLVSVGLAVSVMVVVTRNITRPLDQIVSLTGNIAAGRVREALERLHSDELKRLLPAAPAGVKLRDETFGLIESVSTMTESLNALLAKVSRACNQVAGSAGMTADTVREIEAAVAEQAASTNQVSATSRQIHSTAQELAKTMQSVTRMAAEAAHTANDGVGNLDGIGKAIETLVEASQSMVKSFEAIEEKAGNIDRIITTITKIANRTNLLSLNAAIEAEKAGEKAGGFSVVAIEVRRLADQTAVAALDIERQIREMQNAVREGVASASSYTEQTRTSSAAVADLSAGLGRVIDSTTRLGPEFASVNSGMQMQFQGAGQIADSMIHLGDAASQTKSSLEGFRRVAEDLHQAVAELQAEVGRFSTAS
jgi:methyl-accepting chemotaxis protein